VTRPDSWSDTHKLSQLLDLWKRDWPDTYTVRTLLIVLRQLGLRDMEQWIRLMAGRRYDRTEDIEQHAPLSKGYKMRPCKLSMQIRTVSPASEYCHSVSPTLLNTSYSDCLSPISDKEYAQSDYSSDSGLSSTCSHLGDTHFRSLLTIDIETGRITHSDRLVGDVTDGDLIERSLHSVLQTAEGLRQDGWPNFSFMLKKREKFANHITDKKHKGVFGVLYRPEGKMLSRLSEKSEEPLVFKKKGKVKDQNG
jgi:hypothetical protein